MLEEEEHELAAAEEEEEDEDEGPPPGFQCIITPQPASAAEKIEAEAEAEAEADADAADSEEEDGPPPGFDCITPKPLQSPPSTASSDTTSSKQDVMDDDDNDDDDDDDDDDDGPPPGWEFSTLVNSLPKETSNTADIREEGNEELDEGPPPGWESVLPCQMPQPHTPPLQPPSTFSPNSEMESKQTTPQNDNEVPLSESDDTPMLGQSSPATPPPPQLPSPEQPSAMADSVHATYLDAGNNEEDKKNEDKKPTAWHHHASLQLIPSNPPPLTPVPKSSEKAQLVCGTCRKLCLYPRGAKWIRCPGCQEVNFALEAHEVGQVNCGGCTVLLMYPHGAPAVKCSSCCFVTEIGVQNRRPPLSVQQAQARDQRRQRRSAQAR